MSIFVFLKLIGSLALLMYGMHPQLDQAGHQLPKGNADALHHAGVAAVGGEAGDGVDLIEDDLPIRGEEQIHPGEYPAIQGTVNGFCRCLDLCRLLRRDAGGTVDGGGL